MEDKQRADVFASLCKRLDIDVDSNVMALGHLMREWLNSSMKDAGTSVDTGAGNCSYDLWVKFGGRELYINIRESGAGKN